MNDTIKIILFTTVLPLVVIGVIAFGGFGGGSQDTTSQSNFKNFTVNIDGTQFKLVDGLAEVVYPGGGVTKNTLRIFGEPAFGDLTGDGVEDAAVFLEHNPGGSGTFYYAALLVGGQNVRATNAMFLGDRIAPQTVGIQDGRAVYNIAERAPNDPMTARPSVGKSIWIHYDAQAGQIGEWVKNFEGEADPSRMSLDMKSWAWVRTMNGGATILEPKKAGDFGITFSPQGQVIMDTDCNNMGGSYTQGEGKISFGNMFSTLMYCEGSLEGEFSRDLQQMSSFEFTSKGELVLSHGAKTMLFR